MPEEIDPPKELIEGETAGSLLEYGLIIGFTLFAFVIIVGIILQIIDWSNEQLAGLFDFFK
ncbi:MAG: hypothetical protein Kow0069_02040 [Promethearchaeota archaeon]